MTKQFKFYFVLLLLPASLVLSQENFEFDIYYEQNQFRLSENSMESIVKNLYKTPGKNFEFKIVGHTDNVGKQTYNENISRLRARGAAEYLESLPIDISELNYEGRGEINSYDGPNEKTNSKHRKVEVIATYTPVSDRQKEKYLSRLDKVNGVDFQVSDELSEEYRQLLDRDERRVGYIDTESPNQEGFEEESEIVSKEPVTKRFDEVKEVKEGDVISFPKINFKPGLDVILRNSKSNLNELRKFMDDNPNAVVEIQGHTCCGKGVSIKEQKAMELLSYKRAVSVVEYLMSKGIDGDRLKSVGYGFTNPLIEDEKNSTDEFKNRRVEAKVISNNNSY